MPSFYQLPPGKRVRAQIKDIQPGTVTILLENGHTHTARSAALPEARIGEVHWFMVKDNDYRGRIVLEMVKPPDDSDGPHTRLALDVRV